MKPAAGFRITAALGVVLVGYPPGFGPTCWQARHQIVSIRGVMYF